MSPLEYSQHLLADAEDIATLNMKKFYMAKPPLTRYTIPRWQVKKKKPPPKLKTFYSGIAGLDNCKAMVQSQEQVVLEMIDQFVFCQEENFISQGYPGQGNPGLGGMCKYMRSIGAMKEYGDEQLSSLVKVLQIRRVSAGQWCFRKGDSPECPRTGGWYTILVGTVGVYLQEDAKPVVSFGVGTSFGEQALISDAFRNASIKVHEDCVFGVIPKNVFARFRRREQADQSRDVAAFLQTVPQLSQTQWTLQKLCVLATFCTLVKTKPRMEVMGPAQYGNYLAIIRVGEFEVIQVVRQSKRFGIPVSKDKKEISVSTYDIKAVVAILKPKDIFGDRPIIVKKSEQGEEDGASQSLVSVGDNGEVLVIEADNFRRCISKWGYDFRPCYAVEKASVVAKKHVETQRWQHFRQSLMARTVGEKTTDETTSANASAIASTTSYQKYRRHRVVRPSKTENLRTPRGEKTPRCDSTPRCDNTPRCEKTPR